MGLSTGGGEVARYIGRHGTKRVAEAVLVAAVPPIMLKSAGNPEGLPMDVFDSPGSAITKGRSQFYKTLAPLFYGGDQAGRQAIAGDAGSVLALSMQARLKNAYESTKAFSETDFTGDLEKFDVPTPVMHGEDAQIVPVKDSARKPARIIRSTPTCWPSFGASPRQARLGKGPPLDSRVCIMHAR